MLKRNHGVKKESMAPVLDTTGQEMPRQGRRPALYLTSLLNRLGWCGVVGVGVGVGVYTYF